MKQQQYRLCAPCLFGLESVLSGELKRLGFEEISVTDGRVEFSADAEGIARAKAVEMARQHYVEYDSFTPYHTEKLK